jgi:replicative DNA helicase
VNAEPQRTSFEQEAYRHAPYDIEVEQALLGAVLVDNRVLERISAVLTPDHLYDPLHQRVFKTMLALNRDVEITPLTLNAAMKADPGLIEVGGHAYLAGLASACPAMPNVRDYAHILLDRAVRRKLVQVANDTAERACDLKTSSDDLIEDCEASFRGIRENLTGRLYDRVSTIPLATLTSRERRAGA